MWCWEYWECVTSLKLDSDDDVEVDESPIAAVSNKAMGLPSSQKGADNRLKQVHTTLHKGEAS